MGHIPLLFLAFQGNLLIGGIVNPNAELFPGIGAVFVVVITGIFTVIKLETANGIGTGVGSVGIQGVKDKNG